MCACGNEAASEKVSDKSDVSDTDDEKNMKSDSQDEAHDNARGDADDESFDDADDAADDESGSGAVSDSSDNELGWDGEWSGDGVTVTINGAGEDWTTVEIEDEEMHTSMDEVSIEGNTLTGVYRITLEMYPDPDADLPEQEWTITMVKDGAHASYSRTAVLTWFSLNDDGTYGREITKENSASLTLTTNSSSEK